MAKVVAVAVEELDGSTDFTTVSDKGEIRDWKAWARASVKDGKIGAAYIFATRVDSFGIHVPETHIDPIWSATR